MKKIIIEIEENRKNPRQFFEIIKQEFKPQINIVINVNKELVTGKKEIAEIFQAHFKNLLNKPDGILNEREYNIMCTAKPKIVKPTRKKIPKIINLLK